MSSPQRDLPEEADVRELLESIYARYHHDFRGYSMASLRRRLEVARLNLGCRSLEEMHQRVLDDPETFSRLIEYLTVQVSEMFRDPSFYRVLREQIVPVLGTYPSLKVWVAGCSTGEEAYSLAILLREEGLLDRTLLYATDINSDALRKAAAGTYSVECLPAFVANHRASGARGELAEHHTDAHGVIRMDDTLRSKIVFADHSLATDSVFAEVQLVCCRNVLIYFDRGLQERAVGVMKDSLCRRGFLGLGSRETLQFSEHATSFRELSSSERWYQKC